MTLRELLEMAEARSHDNWNHTSALLAMLANVNRDPKKRRAFKPDAFNPHASKRIADAPLLKADIQVLKAFVQIPQEPTP